MLVFVAERTQAQGLDSAARCEQATWLFPRATTTSGKLPMLGTHYSMRSNAMRLLRTLSPF
eukprot:1806162-Amphidinium_carterae.1